MGSYWWAEVFLDVYDDESGFEVWRGHFEGSGCWIENRCCGVKVKEYLRYTDKIRHPGQTCKK
jgi:hypothetical protein